MSPQTSARLKKDQLEQWMRQAMGVAEKALPLDVPVGCVLQQNTTLFSAHNQREQHQNPLGHAELLALQQAAQAGGNWRLNGSILVVTLEPCPMCAAAIVQARVSTLVFGAYDGLQGACGSRYNLTSEAPWLTVVGGVLEDDCQQRLARFFKALRP